MNLSGQTVQYGHTGSRHVKGLIHMEDGDFYMLCNPVDDKISYAKADLFNKTFGHVVQKIKSRGEKGCKGKNIKHKQSIDFEEE